MAAFLRAAILLGIASVASVLTGSILATPVLAWLNYRAPDGPYFPAPLVSLILSVPMTVTLLPFHVGLNFVRRRRKPLSLRGAAVAGALSGLIAGILLTFLLFCDTPRSPFAFPCMAVLGAVQGAVLFGCASLLGGLFGTNGAR